MPTKRDEKSIVATSGSLGLTSSIRHSSGAQLKIHHPSGIVLSIAINEKGYLIEF